MRSNRLIDVILLAMLVAVGAYYVTRQPTATPTVSPTPIAVPQVASASGLPERAPAFQLRTSAGRVLEFDGHGPLIVTLTAIGCQGCIQRMPIDRQLFTLATEQKIPYYNVLVFADDTSGAQFVAEHQPAANEILFDPGGKVFVDQYRGSDGNCWMLIGADGKFLYQGAENMDAIKAALATL